MPEPNFNSLLEDEQSYGTAEFMDPNLYRATTEGDILEFIRAMEQTPADTSHYNPPATCVQLGPQKNTVLHIATSFEHYEIVKLICKDLPFLVAEKNAKGDTALHIAARARNSLLVRSLVDCDCFKEVLSEQNEDGNTALHEALCYRCEEVARMLIDRNRNMSYSVNKEGKSLLYLAAEAGYASIVRLLLENPVGNYSTIGESCKYNSPVHAAILVRNLDVLKILWEKDQSSFNLRCEEGRNPLHYAAYIGYVEGANFLLNKSCASAYQRDKHGLFPIHIASSKGHTNIIQDMLRHCPDSRELLTLQFHNILHVAAKSGKTKAVSFMLKKFELQTLLNERDGDGNTPLHVATIFGNAETASTLTWDERVNLELENNEGFTALDIAEIYMETAASFRKRLTWMALKVARAPRARHAKVSTRKPILGEQPKMENNRDKVNVILLVATLVATVTFTAGFTIPGGYNNSDPHQGLATMLAKVKFQEFVICDTIAMYSSIAVAVTLIWAQLGNLNSMQIALKLALPLLGIALAMMSVAFMAGVYLAVSKLSWLANVVLFMGTTFIFALVTLFVPLCCLASSNYQIFRCISYYQFCLMLYAFSFYTDHNVEG